MKSIKIFLLSCITILFTACGGGGTGKSTSPATSSPTEESPTKVLKSYTQSIASIQEQMYEAIGMLSDNYTKVIDAKSMTIAEADAFYDKLKLMEPDIINTILLEHQILLLGDDFSQNDRGHIAGMSESVAKKPRFIITGTGIVIGALVSYAGYKLYSHGVESKKKLYNSVEYLINGSKENSNLLNHIKEVMKLPKSTTKSETLSYFHSLKSKKESVSRTLIDDANAYYPLDAEDALSHHKDNVVKVAFEGGSTAIVAVGCGNAAGAGAAISGSTAVRLGKMKLAFAGEPGVAVIPNYTGVTLQLTAAETNAALTGAATGAVAVVVKSREKEEQQVPKPETTMTKEQALEQLRKIKNGIVKDFGLEEIASAVITVVRDIAKKSGAVTKEDGTITIQIPKKFQTIYTDKENIDKGIEVQQTEESDIVIVSESTKPVMASNVDLSDAYVEIRIPLQEGTVEVPNTNEWVFVDSRWWRQNLDLEIDDNIFVDYIGVYPLIGRSDYGIHYGDLTVPPYEHFTTEQSWSVPPKILVSGQQYPMNATVKRTEGTDAFYKEFGITITIDDYDDDDYSCMTSGKFEKYITTRKIYVTSYPSDVSTDSWEGEFKVPNPGEYNDKFQIEVYYAGGCTRYIYERKQ